MVGNCVTQPTVKDFKKLSFVSSSGSQNILILFAHGGPDPEGNHYVGTLPNYSTTKSIFQAASRTAKGPILVWVDSCHGGASLKDVEELPEGSLLFALTDPHMLSIRVITERLSRSFLEANEKTNPFTIIANDFVRAISEGGGIAVWLQVNGQKQVTTLRFDTNFEVGLYHPETFMIQQKEKLLKFYADLRNMVRKYHKEALFPVNFDSNLTIPKWTQSDVELFRKHCLIAIMSQYLSDRLYNRTALSTNEFISKLRGYYKDVQDPKTLFSGIEGYFSPLAAVLFSEILGQKDLHQITRFLVEEAKVDTNLKVLNMEIVASPLHIATEFGGLEDVQLLLAHGADANAKDEHGYAPLRRAVELKKEPMVKALHAASTSNP